VTFTKLPKLHIATFSGQPCGYKDKTTPTLQGSNDVTLQIRPLTHSKRILFTDISGNVIAGYALALTELLRNMKQNFP
jgi:hypothetical protein